MRLLQWLSESAVLVIRSFACSPNSLPASAAAGSAINTLATTVATAGLIAAGNCTFCCVLEARTTMRTARTGATALVLRALAVNALLRASCIEAISANAQACPEDCACRCKWLKVLGPHTSGRL